MVNNNTNNMITEDYVSFETAKLLKGKGFDDEYTKAFYDKTGNLYFIDLLSDLSNHPDNDTDIAASTLYVAMKWLREVHNVFIDISSRFSKNADEDVCFSYSCKKLIDAYKTSYEVGDGEWLNYEEAAEAAIKYCLENKLTELC